MERDAPNRRQNARALNFRVPAELEFSRKALEEAGDIIQKCNYERRALELAMLRQVY